MFSFVQLLTTNSFYESWTKVQWGGGVTDRYKYMTWRDVSNLLNVSKIGGLISPHSSGQSATTNALQKELALLAHANLFNWGESWW